MLVCVSDAWTVYCREHQRVLFASWVLRLRARFWLPTDSTLVEMFLVLGEKMHIFLRCARCRSRPSKRKCGGTGVRFHGSLPLHACGGVERRGRAPLLRASAPRSPSVAEAARPVREEADVLAAVAVFRVRSIRSSCLLGQASPSHRSKIWLGGGLSRARNRGKITETLHKQTMSTQEVIYVPK